MIHCHSQSYVKHYHHFWRNNIWLNTTLWNKKCKNPSVFVSHQNVFSWRLYGVGLLKAHAFLKQSIQYLKQMTPTT
jgi:hypothetical protein